MARDENIEMTIEEMKEEMLKINGVLEASILHNHGTGKSRIYLKLPKLNGGKFWNEGKAGTVFYDEQEDLIVYNDRAWAGAKTRDRAYEIIEDIEATLGIKNRAMHAYRI